MAKKISTNYLRKLVEQVIKEDRQARKPKRRASKHQRRLAESLIRAKLLIEQDQQQSSDDEIPAGAEVEGSEEQPEQADSSASGDPAAAVAGTTLETDINSMAPEAIADAMLSGVDNDLYNAMHTATKWAGTTESGGKDAAGIKAMAVDVFGGGDEAAARQTIIDRVGQINTKLGQSQGFPKTEMPALEGVDVNALQDALNADSGALGVDAQSDFKDGEANFDSWWADKGSKGDDDQKADEKSGGNAPSVQASSYRRSGNVMLERWGRLAGLQPLHEINDDERFPFPGVAKVMDGAPDLGDGKTPPNPENITGKAKAFLTKGKGTGGDGFTVSQNQSLANSSMIPTQTNIKVGKSMLFALNDIGQDMEGSYATSDGEILDGHHRWSGQFLRTGGGIDMENVHLIDKSGMSTPEFLTMLTVVANALGRPTKTK